jgi:hypothetical protein
MLRKFERYMSKNIPSGALALAEKKVAVVPYDYRGLPASGKALANWVGWQQREQIEPKKYNLYENKERIGRVIRQHFDKTTNGQVTHFFSEQSTLRKAICVGVQTNHMQSTPMYRPSGYSIFMEPIGYYRSHAMLHGRNCDDPWRTWGNRYEMRFWTMSDAVSYARSFGFETDLVYPHERYHSQKAYADNFNFVREAVSDIEDEETVVYDIMQKLV